MKREELDISDALGRGEQLPFAYLRTYSAVTLGRTPPSVETEELLEARFFSRTEEIRVFRGDGALRAARLCAEPGEEPLWERYAISDPRFGRELTVCRHLAADADGQVYIAATRLADWKGAEDDA